VTQKKLCQFDNTYVTLPERFYEKVKPAKVNQPQLLQWNESLSSELGLTADLFSVDELAQIFAGQTIPESAAPIAVGYAGHQFGHFVPQLGDGRAILLGEIVSPRGQRFDIQLKGSGVTSYSRGGDGLSPLGPVIREYIISEAMYHLGVPTTRSLAAVRTGEVVHREEGALPGAILTRVASSHIRIGHFEYFASRGDVEGLKILAQYTIHRHFPEIENSSEMYLEFLKKVISAQAALIAHWMDTGFIHGVMNTDNMLVSGETIDFGPCAFMDNFSFNQVFSSIDRMGRYSYVNQAPIAQWNLARLAECLLLLMPTGSSDAMKQFEEELANFSGTFEKQWMERMRRKLGLLTEEPEDVELTKNWLNHLQDQQLDYTISFRSLAKLLSAEVSSFEPTPEFKQFETQWRKRLQAQPFDHPTVKAKMNQVNPVYIPRNHQVARAIQSATAGDLSVFKEMVQVTKNPFTEQPGFEIYMKAPLPEERVSKTFCGT
jgi:serine/tyrosine/threonine adenylyltransferase